MKKRLLAIIFLGILCGNCSFRSLEEFVDGIISIKKKYISILSSVDNVFTANLAKGQIELLIEQAREMKHVADSLAHCSLSDRKKAFQYRQREFDGLRKAQRAALGRLRTNSEIRLILHDKIASFEATLIWIYEDLNAQNVVRSPMLNLQTIGQTQKRYFIKYGRYANFSELCRQGLLPREFNAEKPLIRSSQKKRGEKWSNGLRG